VVILGKTTVKAVVDAELKEASDKILKELGMTTSEAIRIFLKQIDLHKKIPFEIKMPKYNNETRKVIDEAIEGKNINYVDSIDQLQKELVED
jgi:DNA-damage-inducible protein J